MGHGASVESDGVEIVYDDLRPESGAGRPVVLVHGFASDRTNNWADTGWYDALLGDGRRVIALDNRGHGASDTPHDPSAYDVGTMAGDVVALLDELDVDVADFAGYSMGARIGLDLLQSDADRVNAAILGGIGAGVTGERLGDQKELADALETENPDAIDSEVGRNFRLFAERTGADRSALAAVMRAHAGHTPDDLGQVSLPVLVAAGGDDDLARDPDGLAAAFPRGESVVIPGEDHLTTVPTDAFVDVALDFLDRNGL